MQVARRGPEEPASLSMVLTRHHLRFHDFCLGAGGPCPDFPLHVHASGEAAEESVRTLGTGGRSSLAVADSEAD